MIFWLRSKGFVLCLFAAVALAFVWPLPESSEHKNGMTLAADIAVALIFLLQGMSLATRQMLAGSRPLRLHVFVLVWNFILFPFLVFLLNPALMIFLGRELGIGLWMLAILPTTIASATALTVASNGAVPQSIFACVSSNLLAIIIVPLLALTYLTNFVAIEITLLPVFTKLCWIVLLPLMFGQFLRYGFQRFSIEFSRRTRWLPQAAILYIVYLSFAQTISSGSLAALPLLNLITVMFAVSLLLLSVSFLVWLSSGWMRLNNDERIAAFFAASQKSIATGLPLLTAIFAATSQFNGAGFVLIPLLIYHPLQLFLGGLLTPRFAAIRAPS